MACGNVGKEAGNLNFYITSPFSNLPPRTCLMILGRGEERQRGRETPMWERNIH